MRDRPYRLTPQAEADLEGIWLYTLHTWSRDQADRYHRSIMAVVRDLAVGRKRGRPVAERPGYLRCAVGAHVVFFREAEDRVEVIRVLHQRMDVEAGLGR